MFAYPYVHHSRSSSGPPLPWWLVILIGVVIVGALVYLIRKQR